MKKRILFSIVLVFFMSCFAEAKVTVTMVEPQQGAVIPSCSDILLKADVQTTEGETIQKVRFYYDGLRKINLRQPPWEYTWSGIITGNYDISACAILDDNTMIWSEPVRVKVGHISSGDIIKNGGFDCNNKWHWTTQMHFTAKAVFSVFDDFYFDDNNYLYVEIENGSDQAWHLQIHTTAPTDSGHIYQIFFMADADDSKDIVISMQQNQDPWELQFETTVTIDGPNEYGPFEFVAAKTDPTNQFRFNIGGNDIDIFLDNLRIIDRSISSVKESPDASDGTLIRGYELSQAFPNPFNMTTSIGYYLREPAEIQLDVFNMNGQKVRRLSAQTQSAGAHTVQWNGLDDMNQIVPSGLYIYRLSVQNSHESVVLQRKMTLLK